MCDIIPESPKFGYRPEPVTFGGDFIGRRVRTITSPEINNAIGHELGLKNWRYGLMWRFGSNTGLRISDILSFTAEKARKMCADQALSVVMIKTEKMVVIKPPGYLLDEFMDYMRIYRLKSSDYVFFSSDHHRDKPMTRQHAWRVIRRVCLDMGLVNVGTHSMRRTFALRHYRASQSVSGLQARLGHQFVSSTLCYLMDGDKLLT